MNRRPAHFLWVPLISVFLFTACKRDQTPKIFEDHFAAYPDIRKKYIYQSVLRIANIKHDPDFNKLIKDVEKITIYYPPKQDSLYNTKSVRSHMRSEGYEELIDVRTANKERISLWINESLPKAHYVGLLDTSADDYIFEIDGELDMEYASSLNIVDQKALRGLLN